MLRGWIAFTSVFLFMLSGASRAAAAEYYVATSGNDADSGSMVQPFRTLLQGASVLSPGDTLWVREGTYEEEFNNGIPGGESWAKPVTIAAYAGETVTIRPLPGAARVFTFASDAVKYVVIRSFILDAVNTQNDAIKVTWGSSGASHHIRIEDSEVMNTPGQGILLTGEDSQQGLDVTGNEFIRLNVHDNGTDDFDHGFYISTAGNLVEGCTIHRNAGWGVHVYNGTSAVAHDNVVRSNRIYDNARAGARGVGIGIYSGNGTHAYNNLIWGNQLGIALDYDVSSVGVFNNVVFGNSEGIAVGGGSSNAIVQNNIVYQSGAGITDSGNASTLAANLENVDPFFIDAAAHDFHLQSGSPAIDQGVTVAAVSSDFDGTSRPQGSTYDIGAFEYCPAGCAPDGGSGGGGDGGTAASGTGGTGTGANGTGGSGGASGGPASGGSGTIAGGTGGVGGKSATSGGSSGSSQSAGDAGDDGGCGCRQARSEDDVVFGAALCAILGVLAAARRRRIED